MSERNDAILELARGLFSAMRHRGTEEVRRFARDSKKQLELRSLKKDKHKMYEKIGREVERLIESGDIDHPGLIRGIERIHQLDQKIESMTKADVGSEDNKK